MRRRQSWHTQRRVGDDQSILDGVVQAHHQRDEGVVDRLDRDLTSLDGLRQVSDHAADVVDRQRAKGTGSECRQ